MADETPADPPSAEPAGDAPLDPPATRRPRRWGLRLALLLALFALLIVAAASYARTEHALQHLYVPALARSLHAEINARGFEHTFPLAIALERLEVFHRPTQSTLTLEDFAANLDLRSLLTGPMPRLRSLRASSLSLTLPVEREEEPEPEPPAPAVRQTPWIPLLVDRLDIDSIDVRLTQDERALLSATLASLQLTDLAPGAAARLSTELDVEYVPPASGRAFHLGGEFDAELRQPENGRALAWEIDWPVDVTETRPEPDDGAESDGAEPLEFSVIQRLEGSLAPNAESQHALRADASRLGEPAGALSARLRVGAPGETETSRPLELDATGDNIRPALLNPLLAALGPESLSSGSLNGRLHLKAKAGAIEIDSELRGRDLRLAARADHGETPPLSIDLSHEALFESEQRRLRIERASMNVTESERQLLTVRQTAPFELRFEDSPTTATPELPADESQADAGEGEQRTPAAKASPARLELALDRVELDRLKPWAAAWGGEWLRPAAGGTLSANLTADLASSARSLSVQGDLQVRDLLWSNEETDPPLGPLSFISTFDASSPDLDRFALRSFETDVQAANGRLAKLNAEGAFNRNDGALSGRLSAALPDLPLALNEVRLIPENATVALTRGEAELNLAADRTARNEPTQLNGGGRIRNANLTVEGNELIRSAAADFNARIPPEDSRLDAIHLRFDVTDAADANAGTVAIEGYWPTAFEQRDEETETAAGPSQQTSPPPAAPPAGKLGIVARGFDLKPWFELFGLRLEDPEGPAWPASADLTLTVDPFGEVFTLEGEERIGPVESQPSNAAPQPEKQTPESEKRAAPQD